MFLCSDDKDTKCSKLLRASLSGTSGLDTRIRSKTSFGSVYNKYNYSNKSRDKNINTFINCLYYSLYWLLRLYRRPAAEDYLLCHTGTLALRVHVAIHWRLHQTFICCV